MSSFKPNKAIVYVYVLLAVILWGFSFIWTNKLLLTQTPIFTFIFFRMFFAGIVLFLVSKWAKKLQKIERKDIFWFILLAFFEPFVYFIGETFGLQATASPSLSAVIIATIPIFTMLSGMTFFKEKISGWNIFGVFITIPGILLMFIKDGSFTPEYWWGIALLFLAVAGAVGYATTVKKLTDRYNSYTISTYQFLIGSLFFLPTFLIFDADGFTLHFFRAEVLIPLLSLSILCSVICFIMYIESIKHIGLTRSSIFTALIPAFTALGAYIYGQERLNALQIIGIAIVATGVILTQHTKR